MQRARLMCHWATAQAHGGHDELECVASPVTVDVLLALRGSATVQSESSATGSHLEVKPGRAKAQGRGISVFKLRLHIFKSKRCHKSSNIAMFIHFEETLLMVLPFIYNFTVIMLK